MWQRYNQTSHTFEKSVDNGATWGPLGLHASIITEGNLVPQRQWPSTAYTDVQNHFVNKQYFEFPNPNIVFYDTSAPTDAKKFDIMNVSQILRFRAVNDAETIEGSYVGMDRAGQMYIPGGVFLGGNTTLSGVWQDYTYTMNHAGFSIGNGSYHGRFTRIHKAVLFECRIAIGSTTAVGSGAISIILPYDCILPYIGVGIPPIFLGTLYKAATGLHTTLFSSMGAPNTFIPHAISSGGALTADNLVSGDAIQFNGFYEST